MTLDISKRVAETVDPPFWSDDFDVDLPKVIPGAREALGDLADLELVTHGGTTHGRLNHPSVWNHNLGSISFFGTNTPCKPNGFWTNAGTVRCALWEAIRDAWCHHNVIFLNGKLPIWVDQWKHFEPVMWHIRGWRTLPDSEIQEHIDSVRMAIRECRRLVYDLLEIKE